MKDLINRISDIDDKDLVIICASIIAVTALFTPEHNDTVKMIISGLFGMAIGKNK